MNTYERNNYQPMTPEELTSIGEELYGKWGWKRKLAIALNKNENTIGRWTSRKSPIEPSEAMAIRSLKDTTMRHNASKAYQETLNALSFDEEETLKLYKPLNLNTYRRLLMLMSRDSVWTSKYKGQVEIQDTENGLVAYFKSPDHFSITVQEANDFSGLEIVENLT